MTETTLDLKARLRDCKSKKQMTQIVKDMIADNPNHGVASILQTMWTMEAKESRRLEQLWVNWLKA